MKRLLTLFILAVSTSAVAQNLIVDRAEVEKAIAAGALVWDVRSAEDYAKGHIPGAVNIGLVADVFRDANREDPPSAAAASRLFGAAGMDILGREVITYSTKGDPFAYYGARMVEYYGGKHAKVFHGGLDDWTAAGKPAVTEPTRLAPVAIALANERRGAISTKDMVERVKSGNAQILDTRTTKEFTGEDIRAIRGGHVTGAVLIPYEANWSDPDAGVKLAQKKVTNRDGMSLKPQSELKTLYSKLDPAKETVVYCQSGVRASETAAVLRDLGFKDVKVYEESWLGYAGNLSAPAENEVFVNVGALNGRLGSLQSRVNELEAELARLKAK
ncbi:Thiosulfate sulfurtransferase [Usitatibacter rugosus]|uniref:Thiosulfate sulfurtransferase n=1 Tax=Usitatibacter rugosus TaxID=2732067 RepID=A0A6M4GYC4_9PROT|nr:rhodanese-like domain-containing protein [Usitatibacter rugosus]QJR12280.1 Thiosulfate sulfurtransferase [Usitatibacter rugosus]